MNNQYTINEAREYALVDAESITVDADLYMQGENWGATYIGTLDEWASEIPESESGAEMTGFYDWFEYDGDYDSWDQYRAMLISQLRPVEITE